MTIGVVSMFLATALCSAAAAPLQETAEARPVTASKATDPAQQALEAKRKALVDRKSEPAVRVSAAIDLLPADVEFLGQQLQSSDSDEVVLAILDALAIRAADHSESVTLVSAVLQRTVGRQGEVGEKARETLRVLYAKYPEQARPRIEAAMQGGDAELARAAIEALGMTRDLLVVDSLIGLLETTQGKGPLAQASASALSGLLGVSFGTDPARWTTFWDNHARMSRDEILEEVLGAERQAHAAMLDHKNREIIRLKRERDAGSPEKLLADLEDDLAGVRQFAAELLARGADEWDVTAARPVILARLGAGNEPDEVVVAFLGLLQAIDAGATDAQPDPERDRLIAAALRSGSAAVVVAAIGVAEQLAVDTVREAILEALGRLHERPLDPAARTALVKSCGKGKLNLTGARDLLIALLFNDESYEVRLAAVGTIDSFQMVDTGDDLAKVLATDADWRVRRRAASALAAVAGVTAVEHLAAGLEDPKPEVRSTAALELAGLGGEVPTDALLARLVKEDVFSVRTVLVQALGELGHAKSLPAVCRVALTQSPPVNGTGPDPAYQAMQEATRAAIRKIAGDDAERWATIIEALAGQGRFDLDAFVFTEQLRALQASGADADKLLGARLALANASFQAGDFDAVIACASEALPESSEEFVGQRSELVALQGRALARKGDHDGAARAYDLALSLGGLVGESRNAVLTRAAIEHRTIGNLGRAIAILSAEQELTGRQLWLLASMEKEAGRNAEAMAHLRAYLERPNGRDPGDEFLARLDLAELLLEASDVDAARRALPAEMEIPEKATSAARQRFTTIQEKLRTPAEQSPNAPKPAADNETGG